MLNLLTIEEGQFAEKSSFYLGVDKSEANEKSAIINGSLNASFLTMKTELQGLNSSRNSSFASKPASPREYQNIVKTKKSLNGGVDNNVNYGLLKAAILNNIQQICKESDESDAKDEEISEEANETDRQIPYNTSLISASKGVANLNFLHSTFRKNLLIVSNESSTLVQS